MSSAEILKVLTAPTFVAAIFSTISIILVGYIIRKKGIVDANSGKVISNLVLTVAIPALAFKAFYARYQTRNIYNRSKCIYLWFYCICYFNWNTEECC